MNLLRKRVLRKPDLEALAGVIAEVEKNTSGEIRVVIHHRRHWKERKLSLHDLALKEFHSLGMQKTRHRTGVLILLLLSERRFQILADEGIHAKVEDGTWERIASSMTSHFSDGRFSHGVTEAIRSVGAELAKYFPKAADDTNELPNDIIED